MFGFLLLGFPGVEAAEEAAESGGVWRAYIEFGGGSEVPRSSGDLSIRTGEREKEKEKEKRCGSGGVCGHEECYVDCDLLIKSMITRAARKSQRRQP